MLQVRVRSLAAFSARTLTFGVQMFVSGSPVLLFLARLFDHWVVARMCFRASVCCSSGADSGACIRASAVLARLMFGWWWESESMCSERACGCNRASPWDSDREYSYRLASVTLLSTEHNDNRVTNRRRLEAEDRQPPWSVHRVPNATPLRLVLRDGRGWPLRPRSSFLSSH